MKMIIRHVRAVEGRPPEVPTGWQKQNAYPSPDGKQTLSVESLGEFTMGSDDGNSEIIHLAGKSGFRRAGAFLLRLAS